MNNLIDYMSVIEDPRDLRGKKYKMTDLLIMTIYGILNKNYDFSNISYFLKLHEDYFKNLLDIDSIPSHDCLSDLFSTINPKEFMNQFVLWIRDIIKDKTGSLLSIDGKAIKSARDKINGKNTPYIVSAYLSEIGLSIGEVKVNEKSTEHIAIPKLLDLIDIKGLTITIDAIGTQESIITKIIEKKAHFVLKVKDNQRDLKDDIKTYFNIETKRFNNDIITNSSSFEKDHGRIEHRDYFITHDVSFLSNKSKWKYVKSAGMVRVYREVNDTLSINDYYYIMDTKIDINFFIKSTRSHWSIENSLHWKLDVILDEDHQRSRVGHSVENLSLLRKIIFNLVRLDDSFIDQNLSLQKKLSSYNANFSLIESLIFSIFPRFFSF